MVIVDNVDKDFKSGLQDFKLVADPLLHRLVICLVKAFSIYGFHQGESTVEAGIHNYNEDHNLIMEDHNSMMEDHNYLMA